MDVHLATREGFMAVEDARERLLQQNYICSRQIATTVFLADRMGKPILVEGPAGVGKTELAKAVAGALGQELIRLQCYEGLDETKALYEWEYAKQLLYTQILKEKIGEFLGDCRTLPDAVARIATQEDVFFSEAFLLPRPLLRAIVSESPTVLLVDEVDKADPEFEAFLLEVLSDFQVSVPELGTLKARHIPRVILTSNNTREMTDTLRRRCLHLFIDYPGPDQERQIVNTRVPEIPNRLVGQVVAFVQGLRTMDLRKLPSIAETLDWARALVVLNAQELDPVVVTDTLNLVLKHQEDLQKVHADLHRIVRQAVSG
jgi:MoxR-like ATPase